jgi:multidrug resistance protein, MATE family
MSLLSMFLRSELLLEAKVCLMLTFPLVSSHLAQAGMGWVDTVMMGQLGDQALAAGGLGATLFMTLLLTGTGLLSSTSPLMAEAYGSRQKDRVQKVITQGLWLSIAVSIPIMILLEISDIWLLLIRQPQELLTLTQEYLKALTWGVIPALSFSILRNIAIVLNCSNSVFIAMLGGLVCNAIANDILMHGKFGFPALGLSGIGWASTIIWWLMFLGLALYLKFYWKFCLNNSCKSIWYLDSQVLKQLLHLGSAIALFAIVEDGLFAFITVLMGQFGTTALASHQIVLQTITMTIMVPLGISYAMTIRVGQLKGALAFRKIQLAGVVGFALGGGFMLAVALLFLIIPQFIISFYLDVHNPANQAVVYSAISFLNIAAVFQLVDGLQTIAAGALRGLQDVVVPMWIGILAYWGIGLLSGYMLGSRFEWHGRGLWCGLAVGLTIGATTLVWRFFLQIHSLERFSSSVCDN